MNRLARIKGAVGWIHCGDVTHVAAAEAVARAAKATSPVVVETREEESEEPIWTHTVAYFGGYRVVPHRGD